MSENEINKQVILGQKYAYATASLVVAILCFINLAGMEKAVLAIVFAWMALRASPEPFLKERRMWAKTALVLGGLLLIIVPTIIFFTYERFQEIIEMIMKMSNGR